METQVPEEKIIAQADYICKKRPRHNHGVRGEYSSLRTLTLPLEIHALQLLQMMYLVFGASGEILCLRNEIYNQIFRCSFSTFISLHARYKSGSSISFPHEIRTNDLLSRCGLQQEEKEGVDSGFSREEGVNSGFP